MNPPSPKSVLCIDLGTKRLGLAGCDPLGLTVTPLTPLARSKLSNEINYLEKICNSRRVKGLIFGLPLDETGNETSQSNYSRNYGLKLAKGLHLPVAWVNEHSSSWEAKYKYNLHNDRSGKLDSASAVILLEQWLKEGPKLQLLV